MDLNVSLSRVTASISAVLLLIALTSCGASKPVRFYVLSPVQIEQSTPETKLRPSRLKEATIGIGPVEIPKYLDRTSLMVFTTENHVELKEFDRWGEPLAEGVTRVLAGNLSAAFPETIVSSYPFSSGARAIPTLQVTVEIVKMNIGRDGQISVAASWSIQGANGRKSMTTGHTQVDRSVPANDTEAAVRGLSYALAVLSQEIAAALAAA